MELLELFIDDIKKYVMNKGHEGAILSRCFGLVSGSFPCEVFKMNTYLSLVLVLAHFLFSSI